MNSEAMSSVDRAIRFLESIVPCIDGYDAAEYQTVLHELRENENEHLANLERLEAAWDQETERLQLAIHERERADERFRTVGDFVTTQLSERGLLSDPAIEVALPAALDRLTRAEAERNSLLEQRRNLHLAAEQEREFARTAQEALELQVEMECNALDRADRAEREVDRLSRVVDSLLNSGPLPSDDDLPMTPEQVAWVRAQRQDG